MSDHEQAAVQDERDEAVENEEQIGVAEESQEADVEPSAISEEVSEVFEELGAEDETAALTERIGELERERAEYLDQWRRSAAEFQNYRKREERLRTERERSANARLLRKLLPVLDDLQRAARHVPEALQDDEWVQGTLAIERKIWNILEQEGVSRIEAEPGTEFNPNIHEALISQPSEEVESGQIIEEFEAGYRHHDNVLRPARVSVAQ
ncbi:MAG: nucleotide exchange factor GrpE [Chloroflexota bacterium]|nr:nucleotide exchange factor GrpE [Chloroflexota bacterium]